ncbi:multidrug resistance protein, MATE family [Thermotomaculum hydrothermale]|uniref:Multidrug-efflux transporter n=1 Tax=Thermotomaculum hydrothermale TaxID=981385 RepID=A0A7R6PFG7_9BACT|nr:MATE family efflux transporter [Thermotomaculum hydrothermale]BBB32763.1 multidrug resistance protein, MATE family [Thermotomaculum hydrothermale]
MNKKIFSENITKTIFSLYIPIFATMMLQSLYGIIDTIFVGKLGANSLAAVGQSNTILMFVFAFMSSVSIGSTSLIARQLGANKKNDANKTVNQSLILGSMLSLIFFFPLFFLTKPLLTSINTNIEILPQADIYLKISAFSLIFVFFNFMINSLLRGAGYVKPSFFLMAVSNIINVFLDYAMIFGHYGFPFLGVKGAAYATLIARAIGSVMGILILLSKKYGITFHKSFLPDFRIMRQILEVGFVASIMGISRTVSSLIFIALVATLGTKVLAALHAGMYAESISLFSSFAYSSVATTIVGHYLGAKRFEKIKEINRKLLTYASITGLFFGFLFFLFADKIALLFTKDTEVILYMTKMLKTISFSEVFLAMAFVFVGIYYAAGYMAVPLKANIISFWLVRLGFAYTFIKFYPEKPELIFVTIALLNIVYSLIMYANYRTENYLIYYKNV